MLVTLLTDFGTADGYVAAMKGVILSHDPRIRLVDISHEVPPQDVATAGYLLASVYRDFPPGTVHTVVVDPGVGSSRRAIAAAAEGQYFVGPDNGVLDWVLARASDVQVRAMENESLWRQPVSRTFHGRDVFAPTAAALATRSPFTEIGPRVTAWTRAPSIDPERTGDEVVRAPIIHIDRFGNGITAFTQDDLPGGASRYHFRVGEGSVTEVRDYFAGGPGGRPFVIWGSAGYLEIAVKDGSASDLLGFQRGSEVMAERQ